MRRGGEWHRRSLKEIELVKRFLLGDIQDNGVINLLCRRIICGSGGHSVWKGAVDCKSLILVYMYLDWSIENSTLLWLR